MKLRIEKNVHGGYGLARIEGEVFLVEGAIEGEWIEGRVSRQKGKTSFVAIDEVLEASPLRREPPCDKVGVCGGCDFQHVRAEAQAELKKKIWMDVLQRTAGLQDIPAMEVIDGPEFEYRHRVQWHVSDEYIGFLGRRSHDIISAQNCPVLVPELKAFLGEMLQEQGQKGLPKAAKTKASAHGKWQALANEEGVVISKPSLPTAQKTGVMTVNGQKLKVQGDSFFQQNRFLTPLLGRYVAQRVSNPHLIDLFGGTGFFSLMCSDVVRSIHFVERDRQMVRLAQDNFELNALGEKIDRIKAEAKSAEDFFTSVKSLRLPKQTTVIVDPPRTGLPKGCAASLAEMPVQQVIYVACDPATQARDLKVMFSLGWYVAEMALFDLYPNTHHFETVVTLQRS